MYGGGHTSRGLIVKPEKRQHGLTHQLLELELFLRVPTLALTQSVEHCRYRTTTKVNNLTLATRQQAMASIQCSRHTYSIVTCVDSVHIRVRWPSLSRLSDGRRRTKRDTAFVVHRSFTGVAKEFPSEIRNGVLQSIQLTAQHVKFATSERYKARTWIALLELEYRLALINILSFVRWMI